METATDHSALIEIRNEPLDVADVVQAVHRPCAGASVVFIGTVRDHSEETAQVSGLDYEAYGGMARAEMVRIAREIQEQTPEVRLVAVHRVGALAVGEISIVCAASAPHRQQAFDACRELIERIKQRVPIWKRERGQGSSGGWVGWNG